MAWIPPRVPRGPDRTLGRLVRRHRKELAQRRTRRALYLLCTAGENLKRPGAILLFIHILKLKISHIRLFIPF